ncbi:RING/FYVE/PHD zinc finger superfamily protein [Euphorbia peplus]|nr:RING/FYVE/PHD zinc finger superfamily protein [Euphorbia peplus]
MCDIDLEQGSHHRRSITAVSDDGTCFSDAEDGSCYSQFYSTTGGSYDDYSFACVSDTEMLGGGGSSRVSSVTDCSVEVAVENAAAEVVVHLGKIERDCRICHLGLDSNSHESGAPIELGCSCKDDLAAAHRNCAETWFKIKGNKTCEICHSVARNVVGVNDSETVEQSNETNNVQAVATSTANSEPQSFWRGHRLLNFLLACMVFAFVISWLFHFNVPST